MLYSRFEAVTNGTSLGKERAGVLVSADMTLTVKFRGLASNTALPLSGGVIHDIGDIETIVTVPSGTAYVGHLMRR